MTVESYTIKQGDTGPVIHVRPSVLDEITPLDSNWKCFIAVNNEDGTTAVAKREVTTHTPDNLKFVAALFPSETQTLQVDGSIESFRLYKMIIEVSNVTLDPPFNIEKHYKLKVEPQGIT